MMLTKLIQRLRFVFMSAMLAVAAIGTAHATTGWEILTPPATLSAGAGGIHILSMVTFNGGIYIAVGSVGDFTGTNSSVWKSTDNGNTWLQVARPSSRSVEQLIVYGNALYARELSSFHDSTTYFQLYRTTDGTTWTPVGNETGYYLAEDFSDGLLGSYWYLYKHGNDFVGAELARLDLSSPSPTWQTVSVTFSNASFSGAGRNLQLFGVFKNGLFVILVDASRNRFLLRSTDGTTWTRDDTLFNLSAPSNNLFVGRTFEIGNYLYVASTSQFSSCSRTTDLSGVSVSWEQVSLPATFSYLFDLNGTALGVANTSYVWSQAPSGTWQRETLLPNTGQSVAYNSHVVNDYAFLYNDLIARLKTGVTSVDPQPLLATEFTSGQTDAVALSWSMPINITEEISNLLFHNNGTADYSDIEAAKVVRSSSLELVANLEHGNTAGSWRMPAGTSYEWSQNDEAFSLVLTISATARDKSTCSFVLDSMDFDVNETYSYQGTVGSTKIQSINLRTTPSSSVDGVLTFPQPAKDSVHFMYDLSENATVKITIYDPAGLIISEINDANKAAGLRQSTTWATDNIASGAYYAVIKIKPDNAAERTIKKTVFIRK